MFSQLLLLSALCGAAFAVPGSHSLRYFYTGVQGAPGVPEFTAVGYVDDQQFVRYESNSESRRMEPRQQWIQDHEGPGYWETETHNMLGSEQVFKANVKIAMGRYNETRGVHSLQFMYGCEVRDGVAVGGFWQYGYDSNDFISFDKETMTWVAPTAPAAITKNKWDRDTGGNEQWKDYLEQECVEWLLKYLEYGEKALTPVPPKVSLSSPRGSKISCLATGFYPRAIEMKLQRNGQTVGDMESSGILPNGDGTFQLRKSLEINPEDTEGYTCEVDHSSLTTPITTVYTGGDEGGLTTIIIAVVVVVLVLVALAVGGFFIYKKKVAGAKPGYTPAKQNADNTSSNSSNPSA